MHENSRNQRFQFTTAKPSIHSQLTTAKPSIHSENQTLIMNFTDKNITVIEAVRDYLLYNERAIDQKAIDSITSCGVDSKRAFSLLFKEFLGLDSELFNEYFVDNPTLLDRESFSQNPYYKNISFPNKKTNGGWLLGRGHFAPYEVFVKDDYIYSGEKVIPSLGYFDKVFFYPEVKENNRTWMTVTPNEINTMKEPIEKAYGKVLTFGLGLGYFAYMCSLKDSVQSVTVVEKDENVIRLFKENILPQFSKKEKINIIKADAYEFLSTLKDGDYDYAFVDIYHDAGDGLEVYKRFKSIVGGFKATEFDYWIEKSIRFYL